MSPIGQPYRNPDLAGMSRSQVAKYYLPTNKERNVKTLQAPLLTGLDENTEATQIAVFAINLSFLDEQIQGVDGCVLHKLTHRRYTLSDRVEYAVHNFDFYGEYLVNGFYTESLERAMDDFNRCVAVMRERHLLFCRQDETA